MSVLSSGQSAIENVIHPRGNFNYLVVKCKYKGKVLRFIFDNGAEISLVRKDLFRRVKVFRGTVVDAKHQAKEFEMTKKKIKMKLMLPSETIVVKQPFILMDTLPELFVRNHIDGVLGNNVISQFDWDIDFKTRTVDILGSENETKDGFYEIAKNGDELIQSVIYTGDSLNVKEEIQVLLDCGFNGIVKMSKKVVDEYSEFCLFRKGLTGSIISQSHVFSPILASDLILDDMKVSNIPIVFSERFPKGSALIGLGFLSKFEKVIILNSKGKLLLKKKTSIEFTILSPDVKNDKIYGYLTDECNLNKRTQLFKIGQVINLSELKQKEYMWRSTITDN